MNNLYFIRKDDRLPPADVAELNGDRYDLPVIEEPMLQELADSATKKSAERRYHQRFQLNKDVYALIRSISAGPLKIEGKSMGCIACAVFNAKPAKLGNIDNISMGGLTFQHVDSKLPLNNTFVLDILVADCGFYLASIPFRLITDAIIPDEILDDPVKMRQVRLQFKKLGLNQQAKLHDFLLNHGAEIDEIGVKD